jgi:hypothetical protein
MVNADMGPMDVRGRAIAHYFYDELEKISAAMPRAAADITAAMGRSGEELRRLDAAAPKAWYNPKAWVGEAASARRGVKARGKAKHTALKGELSQAKTQAFRDVNSSDPATRERALKWLEGAGDSPSVSFGAAPEQKSVMSSPLAQKAAIGVGGVGLGTAGLLYAQNRANQGGGYGSY